MRLIEYIYILIYFVVVCGSGYSYMHQCICTYMYSHKYLIYQWVCVYGHIYHDI